MESRPLTSLRRARGRGAAYRAVGAIALALLGLGCAEIQGARLYQRGTLALDRGDAGTAVDDLEAAARLVPQASEIQNHLGLAYLEQGRTQEARVAFERALELDCDNRAAQANLLALSEAVRTGTEDRSSAHGKPEVDMPETSDGR